MKFGCLFARLLGIDWGKVHLKHGKHTMFVPTKVQPGQVWVSMKGVEADACGHTPDNTASWKVGSYGVEFKFQIGSEKCTAEWFVSSDE
jgi:hypothetical protein